MLSLNGLTVDQSNNIFLNSNTVELLPVVSAEWNQNLFNQPYITTAGNGTLKSPTLSSTPTPSAVTGANAHPTFTTNSFSTTYDSSLNVCTGSVSYSVDMGGSATGAKFITYVKTNSSLPVVINAYAKGNSSQYGSQQAEADSFNWTPVIVTVGDGGTPTGLGVITFTLSVNTLSSDTSGPTIYFTQPEAYETTLFDYQYGSLWPTDSAFSIFRPGESYVQTGNTHFTFPSNFRKVSTQVLNTQTTDSTGNVLTPATFPMSSVMQNPQFSLLSSPVPFFKYSLPNDMAQYKYFVSESNSSGITNISAMYEQNISVNKIVLKFNTIMTIPKINIYIDNVKISVDGSSDITPDDSGLIVLYSTTSGNTTTWSKNKWSSMPNFGYDGVLSNYTKFKKITVTQIDKTIRSSFSTYAGRSANASSDLNRMQLIEVSPRLEVDLSNYVINVDVSKSLDSKNNMVPISSINTDDATIELSAIPVVKDNSLIPLFSSQSNLSSNVLTNMLRKNIKFYLNFNLKSYFDSVSGTNVITNNGNGIIIPGGVYYSDVWDETDIKTVKIQAFDVTRYLQTVPAPDYVANLKSVFEVITNVLDLVGFTDYDYDTLYQVCNDKNAPLDLAYYFCNSKDTTVIASLADLFLAYQIGAYIDEYGVMKFKSLAGVLGNNTSNLSINDSQIVEGGYSISNKAKPGKVSLRYTMPKIKQSLALQNATDPTAKNGPSFIYTTSNDVVWSQQNLDSVGFNYLSADFLEKQNVFSLNVNDTLDIFHTYTLNSDGYAAIENEIVSFEYKEYRLSDGINSPVIISVKNDLELGAEINRFIKKYEVALINNSATITNTVGDGTHITYTASNSFKVGQKVSVIGITPANYNIMATITSANANSFQVASTKTGTYVSGGEATVSIDYNVSVTPTGRITNVKRGLFGTVATDHKVVSTNIASKGLTERQLSSSYSISTSSGTSINNNKIDNPDNPSVTKIMVTAPSLSKLIVYPTSELDKNYKTYSTKFDLYDQQSSSAGLFFNATTSSNMDGTYFVEMVKINQLDSKTNSVYNPPKYRYLLVVYKISGSSETIIAWSDITGIANNIINNFEKVLVKIPAAPGSKAPYAYGTATDQAFNLKITHYFSDGKDGENGGELIDVFLNNVEIRSWQLPSNTNSSGQLYTGYAPTLKNTVTGLPQKVNLTLSATPMDTTGTKFGFFASSKPIVISGVYYPTTSSSATVGNLREIYACSKPLKERSVSYWYQDREFLNGMIQNQNLFSKYDSYVMQTNPEVAGINYYDVQYTTPAATSVDVLPIEYLWYYFPGTQPIDQQYYQKQLVDEYSLSYSTPINTGFRARMAIANNSSHMVYLKKDSDNVNQFSVTLNLWTHEIVAQSDPEIMEKIIDKSNISEVVQIDSLWIQSKESANRLLSLIEKGIDGFSKDTTIQVFGNPLIQVGDIITVTYSLAGLKQQKYLVHSVSHAFGQGLKTTLVLNMIDKGISY
jgi:hypothetical protein